MLKILVIITLSSLACQGQIYQRPNNSYGIIYNRTRSDSTLLFATYCGVPVGIAGLHSINQKMSAIYYDSCGHRGYIFDPTDSTWAKIGATKINDSTVIIGRDTLIIGGSDNSIATGSRTATGNYIQNWNRHQLIFDTTKDVRIYSNAPDWNFTNNTHTFLFEHYNSVVGPKPLSLKWSLKDVTNSFDSVGGGIVSDLYSTTINHYTGSQSGNLYLNEGGAQLAAYGTHASTITAYEGTITLDAADSIQAKLTPAASADSMVGVRSFGFGLNTLVKAPIRKDIDVFLVAGQSNAVGHGDSALSPAPISGKTFQINQGVITPAKDPIGVNIGTSADMAIYGSAWPQFCNTYFNRTSRMVCVIPSSHSGTSQTAAGDVGNGNWDTTGVLFDSAVARVNSAMNTLRNSGYNPIFKGVMWMQGESDAIAYEAGTITVTDYTNAFKKMLRKFRQNFGASMPFYVIQTGTSTTHADVPWWQDIRNAQQTVANQDSMTTIVNYNARNFITRSLMVDNIHYNQVGLNEIGQLSALAVTSHMKNIWQTQTSSVWYPQTIGIGGAPVSGFDIEVLANASGNRGLKLLNASTASATAMVRFENNVGINGYLWSTSTAGANNIGGASALILYSAQSGGLRLVTAGGGDIVFSKFATLTSGSFGRFVNATGNFLYNTETDNTTLGKFQINSTSWFNGLMKLHGIVSPPSTYNVLVHSNASDSAVYGAPVNMLRGYNQYTALLSQSGTSAPTASVVGFNEIGSIVWARSSTGVYIGTLSGAFTSSKTFLVFSPLDDGLGTGYIKAVRTDANTITVTTKSGGTLTDALLVDYPIEIRVYP